MEAPVSELPISFTLASMDAAGVDLALLSAWQAPHNDLISNDEVAEFVRTAPDRFVGVGSVDIAKPMEAA